MAAKHYQNAIEAYQNALKAMPGDAVATKGLADAKAAKTAKKDTVPPKKEPPTKKQLYDAWLERAEQLMTAKQYQGAVQAYQNALLAMPGDPTATKGLADARTALNPTKDPVPPKRVRSFPRPTRTPPASRPS